MFFLCVALFVLYLTYKQAHIFEALWISLIVFAAQNLNRRSARYEAISLSRMGGPALRGLSEADKASLINVRLP